MFDPEKIIEKENIALEEWEFEPPIQAIYVADTALERPVIGLARHLRHRTQAERRCILAEELGHHYTTSGVCIVHFNLSFSARLEVSRAEHQALKWAALHLVPRRDLLRALAAELNLYGLAEEFDVTPQMMEFRLKLLEQERQARA